MIIQIWTTYKHLEISMLPKAKVRRKKVPLITHTSKTTLKCDHSLEDRLETIAIRIRELREKESKCSDAIKQEQIRTTIEMLQIEEREHQESLLN